MMRLPPWSALCLLLAAGCGDSAYLVLARPTDFTLPPGAPPPVVMDAAVYLLTEFGGTWNGGAYAHYTNTTERPVYFRRCHADDIAPVYRIVRSGTDTTRVLLGGPPRVCDSDVPTGRVDPGTTLVVPVNLSSGGSAAAAPAERSGYFRVALSLCARPAARSDDCLDLPLASELSAVFEVRAPSPR